LDKVRDKDGNLTEHIRRVEEDIPKFADRYSVREDGEESGKVRAEGAGMGRMDYD
jgi:hypothetical protein